MRVRSVPSLWLEKEGRRLDCGPYLSGAIEAKVLLEKLPVRKAPLREVTLGGMAGIFNGPRFSRAYVDDPAYGISFLGSTDILAADLSWLPLISKRQVAALPELIIEEGWTLITCSGTIGRMAYARPEMVGMAGSQHFMRVVPDPDKILPGYLYAYMSSRFGVPLVVGGTYGAIIQHIEPPHIADLPVPLAPEHLQKEAHNAVTKAAQLRSEASTIRKRVRSKVEEILKWSHQKLGFDVSITSSAFLSRRLDAFHFSFPVSKARDILAKHHTSQKLGDLIEKVFEPSRSSRNKVADPAFGVPFISSSEVFRTAPAGEYLVSRKTKDFESLVVTERDLLLPRSGQIGGIIGRAVLPTQSIFGNAASEHLVRVRCKSKEDAAYLWAIFASEPGYYAAIGTAYGSSIPSLDCELLSKMRVPWLAGLDREDIEDQVILMQRKIDDAIMYEQEAVSRVEGFISGAETKRT